MVIVARSLTEPLAGDGPISDGIPLMLGRGGLSERVMPKPPRGSHAFTDDDTLPMRKARP